MPFQTPVHIGPVQNCSSTLRLFHDLGGAILGLFIDRNDVNWGLVIMEYRDSILNFKKKLPLEVLVSQELKNVFDGTLKVCNNGMLLFKSGVVDDELRRKNIHCE
jgi:hypothetical protein